MSGLVGKKLCSIVVIMMLNCRRLILFVTIFAILLDIVSSWGYKEKVRKALLLGLLLGASQSQQHPVFMPIPI